MFLDETKFVFCIRKLLRTFHPKFPQHPFDFKAYSADGTVCVVGIVKAYSQKAEMLRVCLSLKTLGRWVMDILQKAGINHGTSLPYPVSSATTSSSFQKGVSFNYLSILAG